MAAVTTNPEKLSGAFHFALTPLRADILNIFIAANKPLTAYQVLAQLIKKRPKAKPPTVYRVLDFLSAHCVLHRIQRDNAYVLCQLPCHQHDATEVMVVCRQCHRVTEFTDEALGQLLRQLSMVHGLQIESHLLELAGHCSECAQ